jgi:hypothetical protein
MFLCFFSCYIPVISLGLREWEAYRVAQLVKEVRYKAKGCGFDSR